MRVDPRRFALAFGLAIVLLLAAVSPSVGQTLDERLVRSVMEKAMRCQNLRMLHAVVVFNDTRLLSLRLRLLENGTVVDIQEPTLVAIGSVSKGMFCSALPAVQDEIRRLRNDPNFNLLTTPLRSLLGNDFWYLDFERTEKVTLQDLVSHTTGLTRHDLLINMQVLDNKREAARRIGRLDPAADFRNSFIYNNLAFIVAENAVETLLGRNFTDFMRAFLWQPRGMSGARGNSEMPARSKAEAHAGIQPWVDREMDIAEAAGGIYLGMDDMEKYMKYHLSSEYQSGAARKIPFVTANSMWRDAYVHFNKMYYQDSVADLPQVDYEGYGYGWQRAWYRDSLMYQHGGVIYDNRCELLLLPKKRVAAFAHVNVGDTNSSAILQSAYANLLNAFLVDMATRNASFVTESNVCQLFKDFGSNTPLTSVQKRLLTADEEAACTGSFGNFGMGSLPVSKNSSSGLLNVALGVFKVELLPIRHYQQNARVLEFLGRVLQPEVTEDENVIVNSTDTHYLVKASGSEPPVMYLTCDTSGTQPHMSVPFIDPKIRFVKGLNPDSWVAPVRCPDNGGAVIAASRQATLLLPLLPLLLLLLLR